MDIPQNKTFIYLLILAQTILSFMLGVFGNKIAEIVSITPGFLLAGTLAVMAILFVIVIMQVQPAQENQVHPSTKFNSFGTSLDKLGRLLLTRVITVFPFGVVIGSLTAAILVTIMLPYSFNIAFIVGSRYYGGNVTEFPGPKNYEIVCFIFAVINLFLLYTYRPQVLLNLSYAIGFALGAASVIVFLDPGYNEPKITFIGWCLATATAAAMVRYQGLRDSIRKFMNTLMKEH